MKPTVFEQTLRKLSRRSPFQSYQVELVSGSRIVVQHPEALAAHRGTAVYFAPDGGVEIFDAEEVSRLIATAKQTTKSVKQS